MEEDNSTVFSEGLSKPEKAQRTIYLNTIYKDSKESFKHIFTLSTGILVLYTTLGANDGEIQQLVVTIALIAPLLISLAGFYVLKLAGEKATNLELWAYHSRTFTRMSYKRAAIIADWFLEASGMIFILAVIILVSSLII